MDVIKMTRIDICKIRGYGDTKEEIRIKESIRYRHENILSIEKADKWCNDCFPTIDDIIEAEINTPIERKIVDFKLIDKHVYNIFCHCNGYEKKEVACYITYGFQGWEIKR